MEIEIRYLEQQDIPIIVSAFTQIGWSKPASLFQNYLKDHEDKTRFVWVAFDGSQFMGYVTLNLKSEYIYFRGLNIPEINDLNVLPQSRKNGVGSALLDVAEVQAKKINETVGIGVGLNPDYGDAQRLYVKRGYVPDGKGVSYLYEPVVWEKEYRVDDDLVLWFLKYLGNE